MVYQISTDLILQEFTKQSECPLCEIKRIVEKQLVESYLNEKVMVVSVREEFNKKGFCAAHYDQLFAGQSKLGLALQTITRMNVVGEEIVPSNNYKACLKHAEKIDKSATTCIICDEIDSHMQRYYRTIAELYLNDSEFVHILNGTHGFCLHHYSELIKKAKYAKTSLKPYLLSLTELEKKYYFELKEDLQWFCDHHDYRNSKKPLGAAADALPRARTRIYGKKSIH